MNGFEKRSEEKRKQILATTFSLMNSKKGTEGLTIDEVVKQSGISKATIFKYFDRKENLIHQVFMQFMTDMADSAKKIMAEGLPFEETLIAMSQNKIRYLERIEHQFYLDLMAYYTKKNDQEFSLLMEAYTQESFHIMLDIFHRGRKEGKVDLRYSDEFLILFFHALVEGISNPKIYDKILPYTAEWTEVLVKGIAPNKQ
ncbi:TetR/AcrR family transcriptional regulator [Listeria ivanovii]|uniref:TetR/AcrR family transcriptional regulator n=1 Tax=Listeria ivanovii TaxID=1638 RepID=UPI001944D7AC|nr:TetR/AcrR family transcriptional regulator [Listeria ivanovii]MBM5721638.1 TetR/AcrR family transcriptional regulator [Listeria ivanovii]